MSHTESVQVVPTVRTVEGLVALKDFEAIRSELAGMSTETILGVLGRLGRRDRAVVYRMLPKERALKVFEHLDAPLQGELLDGLKDEEVAHVFGSLDPDDRVSLLDELPAAVATQLLQDLPKDERDLTAEVLGYEDGMLGRRMNPEYVSTHPEFTCAQTLERVHQHIDNAETVYTIPVTDSHRQLQGVVSLRQVMASDPRVLIQEIMETDAVFAEASEPEERAARRCADMRRLCLPVVDNEHRLVGVLTVDDALDILEDAESEDQARLSGSEPLRRPYLSTPVGSIVRSRVVWLLVLAIGATLTVQVLEQFESTLEQMVVLSVFIPLLIGTGGNTGNQAATTVTRALSLGDVHPGDVMKVGLRELAVGALLGLLLGAAGFLIAGFFYGWNIGLVIGLTLMAVCTMAATVGGLMPLAARALKVDPAVFSNPFITTFVDASGLIIYFFIAKAILGL